MLKYHGSKNAPSVCPSCGTSTVKGMVRVKAEKFFCSASCAKSFVV
jgi:transposase-like protein